LFLFRLTTMTPNTRQRSFKEVGSSSQASTRPQRTSQTFTNVQAQDNIPHPLGLMNYDHVAKYNCLNKCIVVATRYYNKKL